MATKKVRVLVDQVIDGKDCRCGEVIEADSEVLKSLIKSKQVDGSKAGVEYALGDSGGERVLCTEDESVVYKNKQG